MTTALFFQFYSNAFTKDVNQLGIAIIPSSCFSKRIIVFRPECIQRTNQIFELNFIFWSFKKSHISILDGTII